MKALSLTQPWATLVALGAKRIETRGWKTSYRGPLAIAAAKAFPVDCRDLCDEEPFRSVLRAHGFGAGIGGDLPRGVVLCTTELIDCVPTEKIREASRYYSECVHEEAFGNYDDRRYGFLFGKVTHPFTPPVPARGALGLWEWESPE
jgi:hypothetical protein